MTSIKRIKSFAGPFPYNPTILFLFLFTFYLSRFIPIIGSMSQGVARVQSGLIVFALAIIPSSAVAIIAWLLKKYRPWSAKKFSYYILEIVFLESLLAFYLKIANSFMKRYLKNAEFFDLNLSPVGAVLAVSLGLMVLSIINRSENQITARLLFAEELVLKLQRDRAELVFSEEKLRQQTSRFLHNRVQSDLMVIAMKLKNLQRNSSADFHNLIGETISSIEKTRVTDLRNLVEVLTPNFRHRGLEDSLFILLEPYRSTIRVSLESDAKIESLSEESLLGIFRIVEQALLNSLVHGPAENVEISIKLLSPEVVELNINDDGPGSDGLDMKPGVGTAVIDSWISILSAEKFINSELGKGFQLRILIPV